METSGIRYYDEKRITNTYYLVMAGLERYIAQEIFKNDGSRVIYTSPEYAFRQRYNLLFNSSSVNFNTISAFQLQFPFASYYRNTNWTIDTRMAIQNATAALYGYQISESIGKTVRFLQTETKFDFYFYFNRDDDAQNAYDILLYMQNPTPKNIAVDGLYYKNQALLLPMVVAVDSISWTNQFKEMDWLKRNRIIVIQATFSIKSLVLDQIAPGPKSFIFTVRDPDDIQEEIYIAKRVILDFLAFKKDTLLNMENIELDFSMNFNPEPELLPTLDITNLTDTNGTLVWDFNTTARNLFEDTAKLVLSPGETYYPLMNDKSYTLAGLEAGTLYTAKIYFFAKSGAVVAKTVSFTTTGTIPEIPSIIGLKL